MCFAFSGLKPCDQCSVFFTSDHVKCAGCVAPAWAHTCPKMTGQGVGLGGVSKLGTQPLCWQADMAYSCGSKLTWHIPVVARPGGIRSSCSLGLSSRGGWTPWLPCFFVLEYGQAAGAKVWSTNLSSAAPLLGVCACVWTVLGGVCNLSILLDGLCLHRLPSLCLFVLLGIQKPYSVSLESSMELVRGRGCERNNEGKKMNPTGLPEEAVNGYLAGMVEYAQLFEGWWG